MRVLNGVVINSASVLLIRSSCSQATTLVRFALEILALIFHNSLHARKRIWNILTNFYLLFLHWIHQRRLFIESDLKEDKSIACSTSEIKERKVLICRESIKFTP